MKTILITSICVFIFSFNVFATIITIDNNPNSSAQFSDLQLAINSANNDDTLYVNGSSIYYSDIHINKRLHLFGVGYAPNKAMPYGSVLSLVYLDSITNVSGASGTSIIGFLGNRLMFSYGVNNILFERNRFYQIDANHTNPSSNIIIKKSIISQLFVYNADHVYISNNVFSDAPAIFQSNQPTVVISNNLFINHQTSQLMHIQNAIIQNNIFWTLGAYADDVSNCIFNNNISTCCTLPPTNNFGSGNLSITDPLFINPPVLNSAAFYTNYDYHLQVTSPAHNTGSDGTDMGIYGGMDPSQDFTGTPALPQIVDMNITNSVIAPGGNLNVTFKAKKVN